MNVSFVEAELSTAVSAKANVSQALSEAVAAKVIAEQRFNALMVSIDLIYTHWVDNVETMYTVKVGAKPWLG